MPASRPISSGDCARSASRTSSISASHASTRSRDSKAHLIAPVAIASSLGLGHVKVPIVAPFALGVNGNAITVSPALYASIAAAADGNVTDPLVSAQALARVVATRKQRGQDPLTFGMTF